MEKENPPRVVLGVSLCEWSHRYLSLFLISANSISVTPASASRLTAYFGSLRPISSCRWRNFSNTPRINRFVTISSGSLAESHSHFSCAVRDDDVGMKVTYATGIHGRISKPHHNCATFVRR